MCTSNSELESRDGRIPRTQVIQASERDSLKSNKWHLDPASVSCNLMVFVFFFNFSDSLSGCSVDFICSFPDLHLHHKRLEGLLKHKLLVSEPVG